MAGLWKDPKNHPAGIDECQPAPPLFPEVKEYVRTHKNPGQLILSGSVRFNSRKAIRGSLTGRMLSYELLPFSISEMEKKPLNRLVIDLLEANDFFKTPHSRKTDKGLRSHSIAKKYLKREDCLKSVS